MMENENPLLPKESGIALCSLPRIAQERELTALMWHAGVRHQFVRSRGRSTLWVFDIDVDKAQRVLGEDQAESMALVKSRRDDISSLISQEPTPLQEWGVMVVPALLIALHALSIRFGFREALVEAGVWRLDTSPWPRALTASTLHADWGHVLGNTSLLWLLLYSASRRLGLGWLSIGFLLSAWGGFVLTPLFGDAARSLGASGGVFGVLGMIAAHDLMGRGRDYRVADRLRMFGAAFALFAWLGFSEESNVAAHVGGFIFGLGLQFLARHQAASWKRETALSVLALSTVCFAWYAAF